MVFKSLLRYPGINAIASVSLSIRFLSFWILFLFESLLSNNISCSIYFKNKQRRFHAHFGMRLADWYECRSEQGSFEYVFMFWKTSVYLKRIGGRKRICTYTLISSLQVNAKRLELCRALDILIN